MRRRNTPCWKPFSLCAPGKRCFLHFNGSTFDIPYLQHKYQSYRLTSPFKDAVSVDLYRTLRPLRTILQTENFRQKSLEPLAGYRRQDAMDGKELIKVYRTYAKTGGETLLNLLFLHNHDDVEGRAAFWPSVPFWPFSGGISGCGI